MFQKFIQKKITIDNFINSLSMGTMLIFLWFIAGFTVDYFTYLKQGNYSMAEIFDWGVIELSDENYVVCVDFRFHTDGVQEYVSQYLFENTPYLTEEAANLAIETLKKVDMKCYWYGDSKNPIVSMERNFPTKSLIYSLIVFFIYLYFYFMKKKFSRNFSQSN